MIHQSIDISYLSDTQIKLAGNIDVNVEDNAILIVAKNPIHKDVRIEFDSRTSPSWIEKLADSIRCILAFDKEVSLVIKELSNVDNDFKKYVKGEIGNAHLDDSLFVLDVGSGIFVTSNVEVI